KAAYLATAQPTANLVARDFDRLADAFGARRI
ncbi:MAG: hypothetical protein H6Q99_2440, partial [Proteobacteria bacterium]|nr:hypothetical protein [Pseudomonadota bacterium]